jgi:hypothetical protein
MSFLRTMRPWMSLPATLLLLPAACAVDESEMLGEDELPIAAERPGEVEVAVRMYSDPDVAATSFASPRATGGCSSTMIGPNLLMTAAHCGPSADTVTYSAKFTTFRDGDPENQVSETFACRALIGSWPLSDLQLSYCEPNATGESPGDKYGYLGFDTRPVTVGEELYSIWWQAVDELTTTAFIPLYSPGEVTTTSHRVWNQKLRDYVGPANDTIGIGSNLWSQPGTSGSSQVSADTHRIRVGPTSTASNDAPGKWALSMRTLFDRVSLLQGTFPDVNGNPLILEPVYQNGVLHLGLNPQSYVGNIDKNHNEVFDVQEDIERLRGENRRAWTYLGFDNERRNALWTRDTASNLAFDTTTGKVSFQTTGQRQVLRHNHINLKPNTTYRVSLKVDVTSTGNHVGVWIALENGTTREDVRSIPTVAGDAGKVVTTTLRTGAAEVDLAIGTSTSFQGAISGLLLIEEGAAMNFDSFDERSPWLNGGGSARGSIFPEGRTTSSTPNWAGRVRRPVSFPLTSGDKWSLSHRQLALIAKRPVRLCFDVKERDAAPAGTINWGVARVTVNGTAITRKVFTPTSAWTEQCTDSFAPSTADAILGFGTTNMLTIAAYLVDNVRVETTAAPVATAYREGSFWGRSLELWVGTYPVHDLGYVGNDRISSIAVTPGYRVTACRNDPAPALDLTTGTGQCRRFDASAYVGDDFNDQISLIRVEQIQ